MPWSQVSVWRSVCGSRAHHLDDLFLYLECSVAVRQMEQHHEPGLASALGPQTNEKRRLTLEDVERRLRRSAAVFGNY